MGNGPEVPGEWDSSGPSEPPAQLLRRAISHVESLLHRLESPGEQPTTSTRLISAETVGPVGGPDDPSQPSFEPASFEPTPFEPTPFESTAFDPTTLDLSALEPGAPAAVEPTSLERQPGDEAPNGQEGSKGAEAAEPVAQHVPATADPASNVVEIGRIPHGEPTPPARPPADPDSGSDSADRGDRAAADSDYVPLAGVSSTAQAEALRITLHAHEEAHRLRAEANGLRAQAAAEGERILVEARMLSDRLHVESRHSATELLAAARNEANAIVEAARAEAERISQAAHEESLAARAELEARAEQELAEAARAARAEAEREAELIRTDALEQGRAEAAHLVEVEVAAAAAEGRRAVEASRSRAEELLGAANDGIEDVRGCMHRLLDEMNQALVAFNASVGSVETLRDAVAEIVPTDDPADTTADGRRPLGLLFGAPHA